MGKQIEVLGAALVTPQGMTLMGHFGIEKDIDIAAGMFSAVSSVFEDAFDRPAEQIRLGGDVYVTRMVADHIILWVTSTGTSEKFMDGCRDILDNITKGMYYEKIENWRGSLDEDWIKDLEKDFNLQIKGLGETAGDKEDIAVPELDYDFLNLQKNKQKPQKPKQGAAMVKGEPIVQMLSYVKKRKGIEGVNEVLEHTNNACKTRYTLKDFKDMNWYPLAHYDCILDGMELLFPEDDMLFTKACTHFIDNIGMMKFFVKFAAKPSYLMKKAPKNFNDFYSVGKVTVLEQKKKQMVLQVEDFPFSEHWVRSFQGFLEALCVYSTHTDFVECRSRRVRDGDSEYYRFTVNWK